MQDHDPRQQELSIWLSSVVDERILSLQPASADASFRRYFRLQTENGSYIAMDAPTDKEPIAPFLIADQALRQQGVHVPTILAADEATGFVLLEDLGVRPYLEELSAGANRLYADALASLIKIQRGLFDQPSLAMEEYDAGKLNVELNVFEEWYLNRHLQIEFNVEQRKVWNALKNTLIEACLEQPSVWVHRDYHSRNLMVCEPANPGVIDFQDMVSGPVTYDLVSLFKDCYIEWPRKRQLAWCESYRVSADSELPEIELPADKFIRWYDLTGLQRHLKVLGVFSRLNYRDGKAQYLNDLPLVRKYIFEALLLYPELSNFAKLYERLPHV